MARFVALLASGIATGAILAVVALGFVVLHKATGVVNFAHGDLVTLGAYVALWAGTDLGLGPVPAALLAVAALFGVGVVIERVAHAPLRKRPAMTVVVATLAAALVLRGLVALWQGSTPRSLPPLLGDGTVRIAGAPVAVQRIVIVAVVAVVLAGLAFTFTRTSAGRQVRALAADPEAAQLLGVRTRGASMLTFGLSAALAGLAGVLVAPLSAVDLGFGFGLMVTAFAGAVIGGFGNLGGVALGAAVIGIVQQVVGGYVLQGWAPALPYAVILVIVLLRPAGVLSTGGSRL